MPRWGHITSKLMRETPLITAVAPSWIDGILDGSSPGQRAPVTGEIPPRLSADRHAPLFAPLRAPRRNGLREYPTLGGIQINRSLKQELAVLLLHVLTKLKSRLN